MSAFELVTEPRSLTDDGNAYRLIDIHGGDLRYVPALGWHAWDGYRWALDTDGEPIRRARDIAQHLRDEAESESDEARRKTLRSHAKASGSARGIRGMLDLASSDARIIAPVDQLDRDPWLLNCTNGTVDLRTGDLRAHDRADICTRLVPVAYVPDAPAVAWCAHLERVTGGDADLIAYIKRLCGYTLTGHTSEQILPFLYGTGMNGKTTLVEAFRRILGDYAADTPAETLLGDSHAGPQPELVRLRGARLVTAVETAAGGRLNETLVKRLTGGDVIAARLLYSNAVLEFRPTFKLWLVTNNKPTIRENSVAMWRRIHLVPFGGDDPRRRA